jgi:hypothetical protein
MFLFLAAIIGGAIYAADKYMRSRPGGVPTVTRAPLRPSGGFGSRATDFANPNTTTLRYVSKYERSQGVQPNVTVGGKR